VKFRIAALRDRRLRFCLCIEFRIGSNLMPIFEVFVGRVITRAYHPERATSKLRRGICFFGA
jgi:hypothetical protein